MTVHEAAALLVEAFDCRALAYDGPEECEHVKVTIGDSAVYLYGEPGGWGAITDEGASVADADPVQVVVDHLLASRDETIAKLSSLQGALSLIRNTSDTIEWVSARGAQLTREQPVMTPFLLAWEVLHALDRMWWGLVSDRGDGSFEQPPGPHARLSGAHDTVIVSGRVCQLERKDQNAQLRDNPPYRLRHWRCRSRHRDDIHA